MKRSILRIQENVTRHCCADSHCQIHTKLLRPEEKLFETKRRYIIRLQSRHCGGRTNVRQSSPITIAVSFIDLFLQNLGTTFSRYTSFYPYLHLTRSSILPDLYSILCDITSDCVDMIRLLWVRKYPHVVSWHAGARVRLTALLSNDNRVTK